MPWSKKSKPVVVSSAIFLGLPEKSQEKPLRRKRRRRRICICLQATFPSLDLICHMPSRILSIRWFPTSVRIEMILQGKVICKHCRQCINVIQQLLTFRCEFYHLPPNRRVPAEALC